MPMHWQDINNRLMRQGPERSHRIPKQYRYNAAEWMLKSKTGMIWITELDYAQLVAGLYYETLSGTKASNISMTEI